MRETANDIARAGTTNKKAGIADIADIAESMVELKLEQSDIKANLMVLKTEDEILGNLFDDLA